MLNMDKFPLEGIYTQGVSKLDIIKIINLPENKGKLKVCAYARVSKEKRLCSTR